ncbi:MAG: recombinase family protein [Chloroflexi bacterium]|nr:recombinase family protein [Chloroflexota bacterium]MDE2708639.1 recombinase family protein [Chloroflexota bacterium]
MQQPTESIPAALYARVSSDRQDVDLSVAAQLRALRDYAERNGYLVVREYVDEAESGRVADRPQFRKMLDEAAQADAPFQEILVWKFSRFTRKREHAVAFKSMLRRRGIRVTSITEHADDSPTGKLMEAIIESVDEFYSENLAQEVKRGMREAASRGFWVSPYVPYGYRRVHVQDGPKKRPRLELNPPADAVARRIFDMALAGESVLQIAKGLNSEGIPSPRGKKWLKTTINKMLVNESYTGTLVWGLTDKSGAPPVRVEQAFPAIVSREEFERVGHSLQSRAPERLNPRQAASRYLLSGLVRCELCRKALTAAEAKGGKYSYYVCQSILNGGSKSCETPRLNASRFERLIIEQIRAHILTESNIRELVKLVDEEMDGVAREERERLETIEAEQEEVRRKMDRLWHIVESSDMEVNDILPRLRVHQERQAQLDQAADQARLALTERRELLDSADMVAMFAEEMSEFLQTSEVTEAKSFIHSFVKRIAVRPGRAVIHYTIPTPQDSPLRGGDLADVELSEGVRSTVSFGRPELAK